MRFFSTPPYGHAHIRKMEKSADVHGLITALGEKRVQRSAGRRSSVIISLKRLRATAAIPALVKVLSTDPNDVVRAHAARALGEMGDAEVLNPLRAALDDDSERVQMWAMNSLGCLRDRESVPLISLKLEHDDWGCRAYAADALGAIGDQRAIPALAKAAGDESATVRRKASRALRELGVSV